MLNRIIVMEEDTLCPQCKNTSDLPTSRLVQDACGHKKCRICLLNDETQCKICREEIEKNVGNLDKCDKGEVNLISKNCETNIENRNKKCDKIPLIEDAVHMMDELKVIKTYDKTDGKYDKNMNCETTKLKILKEESDVNLEYHTAVITYQNCDSVQNKSTNMKTDIKSYNSCSHAMPSHIIVNESLNPKSYSCNICSKTFTTRSHIRYHSYCGGVKKPFQCDICKKDFIVKSHLQTHILIHNKTKPYSCNMCDKSFTEKSKLNRHKLSHSNEKRFSCTECGKCFKNKENLRTHTLTHKPEKPFGCTECNKRFSHSSNLKKHIQTHLNEKAHMCDQCGKRFKIKWALNVHRKIHTRNRPYECKTCYKNFLQLKDLHRHELIHLEIKSFACGLCGTDFKRKDNLHRHTKNTHPGKKTVIAKEGRKIPPKIPAKLDLVKKSILDTPNAVNVITAPPTIKFDIPKMSNVSLNMAKMSCISPSVIPKKPDLPPINSNLPVLLHGIPNETIVPSSIPQMSIIPKKVISVSNSNEIHSIPIQPQNATEMHILESCTPKLSTISDIPVLPAGIPKKPILPPSAPKMNILPPSIPTLHKLPPVIYKMPSYPPKIPILPPINPEMPDLQNIPNISHMPNISIISKKESSMPVINAPLKLAFKTSAFKNHYNIHRDYVEPTEHKSVYEKILTPTPIRTKSSIQIVEEKQDVSSAICQKILHPYSAPLHYETSFYNKRHGSIKNIKFKLPANYTNLKNYTKNDVSNNIQVPKKMCESNLSGGNNDDLRSPGVIVNTNQHWRRRAAHFFTSRQDC